MAFITGIYMNQSTNIQNNGLGNNLQLKSELLNENYTSNSEECDDDDSDLYQPFREQQSRVPKRKQKPRKRKIKLTLRRNAENVYEPLKKQSEEESCEEELPLDLSESNDNTINEVSYDTEYNTASLDNAELENAENYIDHKGELAENKHTEATDSIDNQGKIHDLEHAETKTETDEKLGRLRKNVSKCKTFACDYCPEVFLRVKSRDHHIKERHPEYHGKFVCLQCPMRFESRHVLYKHRSRAHEPTGEFMCPDCDSKFTKQSGLKRHKQIHSDNPKWVCSYCGRSTFLSKGDMQRHIRNRHTGEKPYACKFDGCDRRFTSSGDRAKHHLHHTGEKRFQCTVCGQKMHTSGELKQHTWIHTGERPYVCTTCGEGFRQSFRLKMHIRIHTGEKPYQCVTCGKAFSDKVYLKRHEAIHREDRAYVCPTCGKSFKHDSNMRRHISTAHENKFPYVCPKCGVGCQGREEFKRHQAKHNGFRGFNCPVCNKAFYTQEDVNNHMKVVHTAVRSGCSVCGTQFKDLRSHKSHLLKIHNIDEEMAEHEIQNAKKMKKEKQAQETITESSDKEITPFPKTWYTCEICHKDFSFYKTLPKHYMRVHKLSFEEANERARMERMLKDKAQCELQEDLVIDSGQSTGVKIEGIEDISSAALAHGIIPTGISESLHSSITPANVTTGGLHTTLEMNVPFINAEEARSEVDTSRQVSLAPLDLRAVLEGWRGSEAYNFTTIRNYSRSQPTRHIHN